MCTSCVAKTASDSAYEYPWSPSRAVPEVEDLTGLIDWEEESEQQANERVKTEKAAKRKKKNKKKNDAKKKKGKRGAHQSQSTEAHGGDDDSKSGGPPTWGAHVAASMLVLVLKTMERHKNGRELNGIDLKKLRAAVAVTGGRSSTAGWDESFGCALTELTADNPHLAVRLISDVGKERRLNRKFDAVRGGCMIAEARSSVPLDHLFPHVVYKTPDQ